MHTFTHIMVAVDFTSASTEAISIAVDLARRCDSRLTLLHVAVPPAAESVPEVHWRSEDWLEGLEARLEALLVQVRSQHKRTRSVMRTGGVAEQILAAAGEEGASTLVMGTRDRGTLAHLWSASVAAKVIRLARIPVVAVHAAHPAVGDRDANAA